MRPSTALASHQAAIRNIVLAHRAYNPRVFGSVASGDDRDGSDIDILVDPAPGMTLLDIGAIRHELKALLGVEVDVLTPKSLPTKFRERVLSEAVPV
jgi:predicted nucleotidyltransferase